MAETVTRTNEPPMDLLGQTGQAARSVNVEYFNYDPERHAHFVRGWPAGPGDVAGQRCRRRRAVKAMAEHGKIALQYGRTGGYQAARGLTCARN